MIHVPENVFHLSYAQKHTSDSKKWSNNSILCLIFSYNIQKVHVS